LKFRHIIVFLIAALPGCIRDDVDISDRRGILEHLYTTTNDYYANFANRPDFDSAYQATVSQLNPEMSDQAFFDLCSNLLGTLQDPHIRLVAPFASFYTFDQLGYERNIDLERVKEVYLNNHFTEDKRVLYGTLAGNIGYLYMPDFTGWTQYDALPPETKAAMHALRETDGLVIDLRNNDGGSAIYAGALASYFTDRGYFWHSSRNKTGPGKNEFDTPYNWFVEPSSDFQYNRPVVVLTSRYTVSAGERFTLAMRELPQVTVIGQRTAGTQGSVMGREMLNGWWFTLTFEQIRDANGVNHDLFGIPSDEQINTTISDFPQNEDPLLDVALETLKE